MSSSDKKQKVFEAAPPGGIAIEALPVSDEKVEDDIDDATALIRFVIDLGQGIPGAITVLGSVMRYYPQSAKEVYMKLFTAGKKGSDIWILYKNCDKKLDKFVKTVLALK